MHSDAGTMHTDRGDEEDVADRLRPQMAPPLAPLLLLLPPLTLLPLLPLLPWLRPPPPSPMNPPKMKGSLANAVRTKSAASLPLSSTLLLLLLEPRCCSSSSSRAS